MKKFSIEFEKMMVKLAYLEPKYALKIKPIIDLSLIVDIGSRYSFELFYAYYDDRGVILDPKLALDYARNYFSKSDYKYNSVKEFFKNFNNIELPDRDFVKNDTLKYMQGRAFTKLVGEALNGLQNGEEYERYIDPIRDVLSISLDDRYGLDISDDIASRYVKKDMSVFPSGLAMIDDYIGGGFNKKELVVVMGGTGTGKSMVACKIGTEIFLQGLNVIYYTFELSEESVGKRVDAVISGQNLTDLMNNDPIAVQKVKEAYSRLKAKGRMIIKEFPTKNGSLDDIKNHFREVTEQKFKPDMIIVDYPEIMKLPKSSDKRLGIEELYERLRGFAIEQNIVVLTLSQVNRQSFRSKKIDLDSASESFGKVFTADLVMSILKTEKSSAERFVLLRIAKNRHGETGVLFLTRFNLSRVEIKPLKVLSGDFNEDNIGSFGELLNDDGDSDESVEIDHRKATQLRNDPRVKNHLSIKKNLTPLGNVGNVPNIKRKSFFNEAGFVEKSRNNNTNDSFPDQMTDSFLEAFDMWKEKQRRLKNEQSKQ